jgi:hypothetical protein
VVHRARLLTATVVAVALSIATGCGDGGASGGTEAYVDRICRSIGTIVDRTADAQSTLGALAGADRARLDGVLAELAGSVRAGRDTLAVGGGSEAPTEATAALLAALGRFESGVGSLRRDLATVDPSRPGANQALSDLATRLADLTTVLAGGLDVLQAPGLQETWRTSAACRPLRGE